MFRKSFVAILVLGTALGLAGCGDDGNTTSNTGGSGGSGAAGANGGSGGAGATGGGGTTTSESTTSESTTSESTTSTAQACAGLGDPCTDCLFTSCNAQYCTCFDNQACGALVACTQNCAGNAGCNQGCLETNPGDISDAALVGHCAASSCPSCAGTAALAPCELCLFQSCPSQMNTCLANEDCADFLECAQGCAPGDDTCLGICAFSYPGGVTDAEAVGNCLNANCSGQCQ